MDNFSPSECCRSTLTPPFFLQNDSKTPGAGPEGPREGGGGGAGAGPGREWAGSGREWAGPWAGRALSLQHHGRRRPSPGTGGGSGWGVLRPAGPAQPQGGWMSQHRAGHPAAPQPPCRARSAAVKPKPAPPSTARSWELPGAAQSPAAGSSPPAVGGTDKKKMPFCRFRFHRAFYWKRN